MTSQVIHSEIERIVDECWKDPKKQRRASLRVLNEKANRPQTATAMMDTITEAREALDDLCRLRRIWGYAIVQLNASGPEWVKFTLPPMYARPQNAAASTSDPDGR